MNVYSIVLIPLFLFSGLTGPAAKATVTAAIELPRLSGNLPEAIYIASGTTDKDEEATIGDPDEQANIGDPGEQATVGDPDERARIGAPAEKTTVGDPGEKAGIGDPGEKSSF